MARRSPGSVLRRALAAPFAALLALSGCDLAEPYAAPQFALFGEPAGTGKGGLLLGPDIAWWTDLRDPALDRLVAMALSQNVDLAIARERVTEAAAARDAIPALASLTRQVDGGLSGGSETDTGLSIEAGAALSVLLDPYGARIARIEAAGARVDAAAASAAAARLLVLGDVARSYVELRHAERLIGLRTQAVAARRALAARMETLAEAGRADRLDLVRVRAELASEEARLPSLRADARIERRRLAALIGRTGDPLDWLGAGPQPLPEMAPSIVVPADLLRWRPDIRAQERLYYAAVTEIGVARAELYPQLSLSGTISLGATSEGGGTASYFAGPVLSLPSLPREAERAGVRLAYSRARSAHAQWVATARDAILEGETALLRYSGASQAVRVSRRAVALRGEAAGLTRELLGSDAVTSAELIEAEQDLTEAQVALADGLRTLGLSYVALNLALGLGTEAKISAF